MNGTFWLNLAIFGLLGSGSGPEGPIRSTSGSHLGPGPAGPDLCIRVGARRAPTRIWARAEPGPI